MKNLTATDRKSLIRLASILPVGSPERRVILGGLAQTKHASSKLQWKREVVPTRRSRRNTMVQGGDIWTAETEDITYRIYSAHLDGDWDDPKSMHRGLVLRIDTKNPRKEVRKKFVKAPAGRRAQQYAQKHYDEHLNPPVKPEAVKGGKEEVLKALSQRGGAEGKAISEEALELIRGGQPIDADLLKKIRHLLYRNRMRGEADLFRVASALPKGDKSRRAILAGLKSADGWEDISGVDTETLSSVLKRLWSLSLMEDTDDMRDAIGRYMVEKEDVPEDELEEVMDEMEMLDLESLYDDGNAQARDLDRQLRSRSDMVKAVKEEFRSMEKMMKFFKKGRR